jgi:hypothetical protein
MTGVVSAIADDLVLGQFVLVLRARPFWPAFIAGAGTTAVLVN